MADPLVISAIDEGGIHRLTMNRPDVRNAFNPDLVHELAAGLDRAAQDPSCRAVVLAGAGKVFPPAPILKTCAAPARFRRTRTPPTP